MTTHWGDAGVSEEVDLARQQERPCSRRLLACVDRSPFSEVCLPYAVSLAKTFGAAITLVHVMESRLEHAGREAMDALGWEISRQEALSQLGRLERDVAQASGQPVEVRLEQGHPAERIVDLAREIDADLIVLGSHGEGGVTAWNLGSTVQQVLAVARCSVLVAHSESVAPILVSLKRLLVPLDGSLRPESVLPTVVRIAGAYGAEVLLVHVVSEPPPNSVLRARGDLALASKLATRLEAAAMQYLEHVRDRLAREVAPVRSLVMRHANERLCLVEIAQREQADLIVLSAHGSACDPARSFGTVAAHLLTHSMVPLLVLQDLSEQELSHAHAARTKRAPPLRATYPPEAM